MGLAHIARHDPASKTISVQVRMFFTEEDPKILDSRQVVRRGFPRPKLGPLLQKGSDSEARSITQQSER